MINRYLIKSSIILLLFIPHLSFSQTNQDEKKSKIDYTTFGLHMGSLLPNQIIGVTEILPMWGARFGFPLRKGLFEIGGSVANAKGVKYVTASASLRWDIPMDSLVGIIFLGLDVHYYQPLNFTTYQFSGGGHVGAGLSAHLGDTVWFRTDMKFNANPGTSLYIGFGLELRFGGGKSDKEDS